MKLIDGLIESSLSVKMEMRKWRNGKGGQEGFDDQISVNIMDFKKQISESFRRKFSLCSSFETMYKMSSCILLFFHNLIRGSFFFFCFYR